MLDWLHSTDTAFRSARQYEQHKTYFSLSAYHNAAAVVPTPPQASIKGADREDEKKVTAAQHVERKECQRTAIGSGLGLMGGLEMSEI